MNMNIQTQAARNTDPATSHMAAEEITRNGTRQTQIELVVGMVQGNPGKTSAELADITGHDRYMIARRLADAEGIHVKKGEARKCEQSKRQAVTWWMA